MADRRQAARSTVTMASGTVVSRITGFAAALTVAGVLGQASALPDAYQASNELPNMMFELLIGGIVSAALIPLFVRLQTARDEHGQRIVGSVLIFASVILAFVGVLLAPWLASIQTVARPSLEPTVTLLLRWLLIEIVGYGMMTVAGAILQSRGRFSVVAFAPALNNLVVIATMLVIRDELGRSSTLPGATTPAITSLAIGTAFGVLLVGGVMLFAAMSTTGFRLVRPQAHPALRELLRVSGWTAGYVIANLIAAQVVTIMAQGTSGGASTYLNGYRLFQLPHGVLAVSIMTVITPSLARVAKDRALLAARTSEGFRVLLTCMVGAAAVMFTVATPLADLFHQGAFDADDVATLATTIRLFALGLVGFSSYLYLLRSYYAVGDVRTPFILNLIENAINIGLAAALVGRFGVNGLVVSYSAAYICAAVITWWYVRQTLRVAPIRPTLIRCSCAAAAVVLMSFFVPDTPQIDPGPRVVTFAGWALLCGAVYVIGLFFARWVELQFLKLLGRNPHGGSNQWQHVISKEATSDHSSSNR